MPIDPRTRDVRRSFTDVLDVLTPDQWEAPSLAAGWTVRHVAAHMLLPINTSMPRFAIGMLAAGGKFDRMADRAARRDARVPTAQLVAAHRASIDAGWRAPGDEVAPITHHVVHGLDIVRPLGIDWPLPDDVMVAVLDSLTGERSLSHFDLDLSGVELHATDVDWKHGSGVVVSGPAADLVLALSRRPAGLAGEGVARLADRTPRSR